MPNGTNLPWGNAFLVNTPSLDRYGLQLYQEQRQREAQAQQEAKQLDQSMQAELGKIRSADTPEFIQQYQKYKDIKKQIYNPKVQHDATEVNKINQAANIELAKAMQLANSSIENKERLKQYVSEYQKNPTYFAEDFKDRMSKLMNIPSSSFKDEDFSGLQYQGNVTNLQPLFDKAKGQLKDVGQPDINENFSPIERQITTYKGYNSPRDYYNLLVGSLRGSRAQRDLSTSINFTPEEAQNIISEYNDKVKNNPAYQKAYGTIALDFPESADYSDVGQTAKLLAMEHGLNALQVLQKRETKKQEAALQSEKFKQSNIALNAELQANNPNIKINDVYGQLSSDIKDANNKGVAYLTGTDIKSEPMDRVLASLKPKYPNKVFKPEDIKVRQNEDNNIEVSYSDAYLAKHSNAKPLLATMTPTEFNLKVQPSVPEKRKVLHEQGGKKEKIHW